MDIDIYLVGKIHVVDVDGKTYTAKELADKIKVKPGTVSTYLCRNRDKPHIVEKFILDRYWLLDNNESPNTKVYMSPDGCRCSKGVIKEITGCTSSVCSNLLKNWAKGDVDTDDLCTPNHLRRTKYVESTKATRKAGHRADWGDLGGEDRSCKLDNIIGPTEYEYKLHNMEYIDD